MISLMLCRTPDPSGLVFSDNNRLVFLLDLNASLLTENTFSSNPQWSKIKVLNIEAHGGKSLGTRVFKGLSDIFHLGYHDRHMIDIDNNAFYGLDNLEELNFSHNIRLNMSNFLKSISSTHLMRLKALTISHMYSYYSTDAIDANDDFFRSIAGHYNKRNVTYLNISDVRFGDFDTKAFMQSGLCDSVKTLVLRRVTIKNMIRFNNVTDHKCSLKVFDISDSKLPFDWRHFRIDKVVLSYSCWFKHHFLNLEELYMNGLGKYIITPTSIDFDKNYLCSCLNGIRKFSLENNLLKLLNYTEGNQGAMEWISLSENILEFISPKFLSQSTNVQYLDLSSNNLYKMQEYYEDRFEILITNNTKLKVLKLNKNNLARIPFNMFLTNSELEELDLSQNKISSLNFSIGQLTHLKVFNLSHNAITSIDAQTRDTMEKLASDTNSHKLLIDLSNMPFICSCDDDHIETIQWIYQNLDTFIASPREDYICTFQGERLYIFQNALEKTKSYCQVQNVKRNLAISLPIVCVFLLICVVLFFKIRRFGRMHRARKNLRSQIRLGEFPKKFVAFLSFSSEEAELVVNKILPILNSELQQKTETSHVLVCSGDSYFRPGYALGEEIIRCIEDSAVIILAVSKHFCQKEWCRKEVQETYDQNKPIILLFLKRVEPCEMGKVLQKLFNRYAHASWIPDSNGGHIEPDWSILCDALLDLSIEH
ncbi:hypothetical protein DPMN_127157 [Dreissena polymorpha]|uniref:TIR domain-containing protein n=1 Tax=Dreissena polymorpha TaxID=45954 RepID=A0A9D4H0R1_DREPO|nr:hypothetical protein DPMN_127157 [Dreissena polymorpha]